MNVESLERSPLIIGGVGGSGTRVFKAIAEAAGYSMLTAPWLVESLWKKHHDNLLMMKFFYTRWMESYLAGQTASKKMERHCQRLLWLCGPTRYGRGKWGWKNPNTLFFLPFWKTLYPNMIFIYVVRDGRDIAFNRQMAYVNQYNQNWLTAHQRSLPEHLRKAVFWERCNQQFNTWCKTMEPERILLTKFESLCNDTERQINEIFRFLHADPSTDVIQQTVSLVSRPASLGRWRQADARQVQEVESLIGDSLLQYGYAKSNNYP
jgi:hypothetical protein